jgi:hypothetical protein
MRTGDIERARFVAWCQRISKDLGRIFMRTWENVSLSMRYQITIHATENRSVGGSIPPLGTIHATASFSSQRQQTFFLRFADIPPEWDFSCGFGRAAEPLRKLFPVGAAGVAPLFSQQATTRHGSDPSSVAATHNSGRRPRPTPGKGVSAR